MKLVPISIPGATGLVYVCLGSYAEPRGYAVTNARRYQRFQCTDCGGWFRAEKSEKPGEKRLAVA